MKGASKRSKSSERGAAAASNEPGYGFSTPLSPKKYYHLTNYGFERRTIFSSQEDYDRFEAYLYLLNAVDSPRAANLFVGSRTKEIFQTARGDRLVAIGAYVILAREFRILATPLVDGGISKFMQKLQTAYTMYFNKKYQRDGRLFHSSYKASALHVGQDVHEAFLDIHLNPAELFDPEWKNADALQFRLLVHKALQYRYSGAAEYLDKKFTILDTKEFPSYLLRARSHEFYIRGWDRFKRSSKPVSEINESDHLI